MKQQLTKFLPIITIATLAIMLLSLHYGWLNMFFFDAQHADVQGIDFFSIPKSFLNLLEKRSIYDTWGGSPYGPHSTWYLAHPAFSVFVAFWFSFFTPWTSYFLFTVFSLALITYSAYLISKITNDVFKKRLTYLILLCAFPTYWTLFVGNMHAPLVLALTLILVSIYELTYHDNKEVIKSANNKLFAGLLISFFTKPIVLLMLPLLLLTKETRRTTFRSLFIYGIVSLLFIAIPLFNPQGIGWSKLIQLTSDFDFIKQNMNIFKNNFVVNEYMKDNSIHWLNLIAQSDYKLMHVDIFSLPVFVDTIIGHEISSGIFKIPIYISLGLSCFIVFIEDKKIRMESTLLLIMVISLTFFLSYNTVWEYQFASILPIIALLPILKEKNVFYKKQITLLATVSIIICLPTLYFLVSNISDFNNTTVLTLIRVNRIIPVLLMFVIMSFQVILSIKMQVDFTRLKKIDPAKLFFD